MNNKPYIDVVIDLETLGNDNNAIVTQISAHTFHVDKIEPLDKYQSFNELLDLHTFKGSLPINLSTLQFWIRDKENVDTFNSLLHSHDGYDEKTLWTMFSKWLCKLSEQYTVRVWGNGILFDIGKTTYNLKKCDLKYPVKFWNERDIRTLTELAANKLHCTSPDFQHLVPNTHPHDALSDVIWEIEYLQKAYDVVMNNNNVDKLTKKAQQLHDNHEQSK